MATSQLPCCPEGALPALQFDYKPQGEHFEIPAAVDSDLRAVPIRCYVVGAKHDDASWKGPLVVLLSDIFGPFSGMHRKLADELAAQTGGIALLPDVFDGDPLVPGYAEEGDQPNQLGLNRFTWKVVLAFVGKMRPFARKFAWDKHGKPLLQDQLIPFLKSKGIDSFAVMGFCFGSWMAMKACCESALVPHINCAIHYHPSIEISERTLYKGDDLGLCRTCQCPQLIHATKQESAAWKPDGAAHKALLENERVGEVQFTLAPASQLHGFMTRADVSKPANMAAVKEGIDMGVAFLKKHNTA